MGEQTHALNGAYFLKWTRPTFHIYSMEKTTPDIFTQTPIHLLKLILDSSDILFLQVVTSLHVLCPLLLKVTQSLPPGVLNAWESSKISWPLRITLCQMHTPVSSRPKTSSTHCNPTALSLLFCSSLHLGTVNHSDHSVWPLKTSINKPPYAIMGNSHVVSLLLCLWWLPNAAKWIFKSFFRPQCRQQMVRLFHFKMSVSLNLPSFW